MNALELLGDLLGGNKQAGGGGGLLKDIFGSKEPKRRTPTYSRPKSPRANTRESGARSSSDVASEVQKLEDLLGIANGRNANRGQSQQPAASGRDEENERALILIRAMVNAGKADGSIDRDEQQKILERVGDQSKESIAFLRQLFNEPLDLDEFIRSVPHGMEEQVYTMSVLAIDIDQGSEAEYLVDLSEGLRISKESREKIHERLGAPSVY